MISDGFKRQGGSRLTPITGITSGPVIGNVTDDMRLAHKTILPQNACDRPRDLSSQGLRIGQIAL